MTTKDIIRIYINPKGKMCRKYFFLLSLLFLPILILSAYLRQFQFNVAHNIVMFFLLYLLVVGYIKRARDIGESAWIAFVPFVALRLVFEKGKNEEELQKKDIAESRRMGLMWALMFLLLMLSMPVFYLLTAGN